MPYLLHNQLFINLYFSLTIVILLLDVMRG